VFGWCRRSARTAQNDQASLAALSAQYKKGRHGTVNPCRCNDAPAS
jgi:hypothetical protein